MNEQKGLLLENIEEKTKSNMTSGGKKYSIEFLSGSTKSLRAFVKMKLSNWNASCVFPQIRNRGFYLKFIQ